VRLLQCTSRPSPSPLSSSPPLLTATSSGVPSPKPDATAPPPSAAIKFAYLASPKLAHRIVGDLEDEAVNTYTEFLRD
ncbi:ubiquinol oxidase (non-electrogenic), partial [Sarracenia purpurea var. burkii]